MFFKLKQLLGINFFFKQERNLTFWREVAELLTCKQLKDLRLEPAVGSSIN